MEKKYILNLFSSVMAVACIEVNEADRAFMFKPYGFGILKSPETNYCPIYSGYDLKGYSVVFKGRDCPIEVPFSKTEGVVSFYGEFNAAFYSIPFRSSPDSESRSCSPSSSTRSI